MPVWNGLTKLEFKDKKLRDIRFGELSFMRAYAYWHLVEIYGNVDLRDQRNFCRKSFNELLSQQL